uniref:Aspartic protease pep1 n=1 Tax=Talaromyces marneffei PM1 TaxID=1077442 RepID=A0A093UKD8_TALMA
MVNYKIIISALALSGLASAVPTLVSPPGASRTFVVTQVPRNTSASWHPTTDYHNALRKYGQNPNPIVTGPISNGTGTVVTRPTKYDREYLVSVKVGKDTLLLDFDTTLSDLWVFARETEGRGAHNYYDTSSGKVLSGYTWSLTYGDGGNVRGKVFKDIVEIGGVVADEQAVEAAESASTSITYNLESDGVVGLAFPTINQIKPIPQKPFFENVKPSLREPVLAAALKYQNPGTFEFGFINPGRYLGEIAFTSVNTHRGLWEFTTDGYCVKECSDEFPTGEPFNAVLDSAISLLILNHKIVTDFYTYVPSAHYSPEVGGIIFKCDVEVPDLIINIGDYAAAVSGKHIKYANMGDGNCFGGIQSDNGYGVNILGNIFFKNSYIVFVNDKRPMLGFAAQS